MWGVRMMAAAVLLQLLVQAGVASSSEILQNAEVTTQSREGWLGNIIRATLTRSPTAATAG